MSLTVVHFLNSRDLEPFISVFLAPSDWDRITPTCRAVRSIGNIRNTYFFFPIVPEASFVFRPTVVRRGSLFPELPSVSDSECSGKNQGFSDSEDEVVAG